MYFMFLLYHLLLLCQLLVADAVQAAQQCRLQLNQKSSLSGGDVPSASTAPQSTATSRSAAAAGASATPSSTTFGKADMRNIGRTNLIANTAYGKTPVRGVNLQVSYPGLIGILTEALQWRLVCPRAMDHPQHLSEHTGNDAIVDEYTFGAMQDSATALSVLQNHWETWITEDDFVAIAAAGLNHVRIPVGYWSVPLTASDTNGSTSAAPYTPGAWPYLLKALNWAKQHNVHVILDLHGAPGSQNGFDNSGQRTASTEWENSASNRTRTIDTIRYIAENIGGLVDIIELLNEPATFLSSSYPATLRQFWEDGYSAVRSATGTSNQVMIGDGFMGVDVSALRDRLMTAPSSQGVMMDYHEYQIFSVDELSRSFDDHISVRDTYNFPRNRLTDVTSVCLQQHDRSDEFCQSNIWTVVGEWSTAVTDCTQWLNGRGVGARWTAPGSCAGWTGSYSNFSSDYKTFLRKYWEVQVTMGENVQGWIYWTWKAENSDDWSYQKGLEGGWIPQDPTNRLYPNICS
ncbi:glycoside hydrolase family 5 protein [Mycena polygramma]|nr:glycoside hydrolase family 5 protein [Mycena polygramma]